ncbi:hypothetical protein [Pseudoalteromonas spongiae]|uniref:hypothetical protein n=1 Tax=Pseudoalteromonas spongiae TaxID=298657 RepID=UPI000C2D081B|nr:hypothetical protein [Pseudoalteromonas spongiae]
MRKTIGRDLGKLKLDDVTSSSFVEKSPVTGEDIEWKVEKLSSQQVNELCFKSIYNKRSFDDLSMSAVLDIFPSIAASGKNDEFIRAVKVDGKYEILAGLRRSYCISQLPEATANLLVAKDLSEKEKAAYADTLDKHDRPSVMDTAISITNLKNQLEEEAGRPLKITEIIEKSGYGRSTCYEAMGFTGLVSHIRKLFPALKFVNAKFLRTIKKVDEEVLNLVIENHEPIKDVVIPSEASFDEIEEIQKKLSDECSQLQASIIKEIKELTQPIQSDNTESVFSAVSKNKLEGLTLKQTNSGVSIAINEAKANPEFLKELCSLLEKHS